MTTNNQQSNFWTTIPGILTGIAAIITAIGGTGGLIIAFQSLPTTRSSKTQKSTKTLIVYAKDEQGTSYTNEQDKPVEITFTAKGEWQAVPEYEVGVDQPLKYPVSPEGIRTPDSWERKERACSDSRLAALVVRNGKDQCVAEGKQDSFNLNPKETAYFLMNDDLKSYTDNTGEVTVELSVK